MVSRRERTRIVTLAVLTVVLSSPATAQNAPRVATLLHGASASVEKLPAELLRARAIRGRTGGLSGPCPRWLMRIECDSAPRQTWRGRDDTEARAWQERNDRWLAADKLRHFFASYGVVAVGYGSARLVGIERESGLTLAVAGGAVAGLVKEWRDVRSGGPFSIRDLVWDAAGIASAYALLRNVR